MRILCKPALFARILLACAPALATPALAEVVVVASAKTSLAALSPEQVEQTFSGKASAFADGRKTHLLDLPESSATRADFYTKALGKNAIQMKAYWSRMTFTGKSLPPAEKADADAVKKALAADPDAVGYVDAASVDGSVKVLASFK